MRCHMLLEAAIHTLFADNSLMENTQKGVVKGIPLGNQVALLSRVCFKERSACELAGN